MQVADWGNQYFFHIGLLDFICLFIFRGKNDANFSFSYHWFIPFILFLIKVDLSLRLFLLIFRKVLILPFPYPFFMLPLVCLFLLDVFLTRLFHFLSYLLNPYISFQLSQFQEHEFLLTFPLHYKATINFHVILYIFFI